MGIKTKDIRDLGDRVMDQVASGAAIGSEALEEGADKMADKTRQWASGVTGSRRRFVGTGIGLVIVAALIYFFLFSGRDDQD